MNWATFRHKLNRFSRWTWAAHLVVAVLLATGFTAGIWFDHAYGAWGDDSPGYTFLAGRLLHHQPLVYQDPVVTSGLEFFGNNRDARWLTPTHHEIISPSGWLASVYPVGLSVIMWLVAVLWKSDLAFYGVVPVCAGLSVGLTYLLGISVLRGWHWRVPVALGAAVVLGSSQLFFEMSVSQPMREIPSMVFLLLSGLVGLHAYRSKVYRFPIWWLVLGLVFAMAVNIRETSMMVFPALIPFFIPAARSSGFRGLVKAAWKPLVAFVVGFVLIFSISLWNSVEITQHKVKFRKKDITSVAITSNIDHIQSLSLNNLFNNQGKFERGAGSLPHYWEVMQSMTPVVALFPMILLGLWSVWKRDRRRAWFLFLWPFGTLIIFSLWINPYARYLLPAFPPLALLSFAGLAWFCTDLIPKLTSKKIYQWLLTSIAVLAAVVPFGYTITQEVRDVQTQDLLIYKSISASDLQSLKSVATDTAGAKPLVIFTGDWQYGISETFELHTQIRSVRFPLGNPGSEISADHLATFLAELQQQGYTLYVWTDETTNNQTQMFLTQYFNRQTVQTLSSSYAEQIRVDRLTPK